MKKKASRNKAKHLSHATDVAIIGMACRFPGANNYKQFWHNLFNNINSIQEIPSARWDWCNDGGNAQQEMSKTNSKWGGFIENFDKFDAEFFNISPKEAESMDPQQRILLELTWSCMEDAGYPLSAITGKNIGVFIGVCNYDYKELQDKYQKNVASHYLTGISATFIPNRISHYFNLHGPSIAVDTACSSSLVAIHQALQTLREGQCEAAFVGGVNIMCSGERFVPYSVQGVLSPTGQCRTFDADADGYVRGEGAGVLLLKPLNKALTDGDRIYGVIKGSAINHGGRARTLTSPNVYAQTQVLVEAYTDAKIAPDTISYIEAHGTGTPLGDPIEVSSLKRAFAKLFKHYQINNPVNAYCGLGTVKSNIGHLEGAAGIAGLIKVLLAMQHEQLPAIPNFNNINPRINLADSPFYIAHQLAQWQPLIIKKNKKSITLPRRAGISSFGLGGVNAHLIIEEAPKIKAARLKLTKAYYLVTLSANAPFALQQKINELAEWLNANLDEITIDNVSYTLNAGRTHFAHRCVVIVSTLAELQATLKKLVQGQIPENYLTSIVNKSEVNNEKNNAKSLEQLMQALTTKKQMLPKTYYNQLIAIARFYLDGYELDWQQLHHGESRTRIAMPTYAFTKTRYWYSDHTSVPVANTNVAAVQKLKLKLLSNSADVVNQQEFSSSIIDPISTSVPIHTQIQLPTNKGVDSVFESDQIDEQLKTLLAGCLYLTEDKISHQQSFAEMGMDSIISVEFAKKINTAFPIQFSVVKLYDFPNLQTLSTYIQQQLTNRENLNSAINNEPHYAAANIEPNHAVKKINISQIERQDDFVAAALESSKIIPTITHTDIAIIGLAGRFPGANNVDMFWENLASGKSAIVEVPEKRWSAQQFYDPDPNAPNKTYSKWGGFLANIEQFDSLFFNISPAEAEWMDPQQRLFLMAAWEALEDAGYTEEALAEVRCGVYAGVMNNDYQELINRQAQLIRNAQQMTGTANSILASRIAYLLNLQGPTLTLDTACSSSLTAIHLACKSLQTDEADLMLAGGVSLYLTESSYIGMSKAGMLSLDGKCKTFDATADGFVPGEGVGIVVLKRLADAVRDGNRIYGVIKGSGINQDGKTNGITAPSGAAQKALLATVYARYGIDPATINYIETHGTATQLGDPIEIKALTNVFKTPAAQQHYCALGAIKTNIGHTAAAAGVLSLIKVLLCLQHRQLVPSLNYQRCNPHIDLINSPFYVNTTLKEWPAINGKLRRAGINAFGFSGTNAHLVIEEAPLLKTAQSLAIKPYYLVTVSAKTADALQQRLTDLSVWLKQTSKPLELADVSYSLNARRNHFEKRCAIVVSTLEELVALIPQIQNGSSSDAYKLGTIEVNQSQHNPTLAELSQKLLTDIATSALLDNYNYRKKIIALSDLYIKGYAIDWNLLHINESKRCVSLPAYPFAKDSYWLPVTENIVFDFDKQPANLHYYTPMWQLTTLAMQQSEEALYQHDYLLVFAQDEQIIKFFSFNNIILVKPGTAFEMLNKQTYIVRPSVREDYVKLFNLLAEHNYLPQRILHLWSQDSFNIMANNSAVQLQQGFYALFALSQALLAVKPKHKITLLYTYSRHANAAQPIYAAVTGFAKTINIEQAWFDYRVIEVVLPDQQSLSFNDPLLLNHLLNEFNIVNASGTEVRYADGNRLVKTLRALSPPTIAAEPTINVSLKQQGVYLLTGGLGKLGYIFAKYIAQQVQAKLVLVGRSVLTAENSAKLNELTKLGAEVLYIPCDLANYAAVEQLITTVKQRFGYLHGIIHAAGLIQDALITAKEEHLLAAVLAPKIAGTLHLDKATHAEPLDFFMLFSSVAAILGNAGQCDYASANAFMDHYAQERERLRQLGKCAGKTIAINWPYWREGGMQIDSAAEALMQRNLGITALSTANGIKAFQDSLQLATSQLIVLEGEQTKINAALENAFKIKAFQQAMIDPEVKSADDALLLAKIQEKLIKTVALLIKINPELIQLSAPLSEYGLDSITFKMWATQLSDFYDITLTPTVFFTYNNIAALSQYLLETFTIAVTQAHVELNTPSAISMVAPTSVDTTLNITPVSAQPVSSNSVMNDPIAIIGIAGYFPQSEDLDAFWQHLAAGDDLITEIPAARWNWRDYYEAAGNNTAKTNSKWGGFLDDIATFDADFFNISPREASLMDPQQRLFLETVWKTIEDAGYDPFKLSGDEVGLFVGVQFNEYQELLARNNVTHACAATGNSHAMLANRISYLLNLQGPSETIDTACSSSLVAVHRAVNALKSGECSLAIAGGVSLMLSPYTFVVTSQMGVLSPDGRCKTFDKDANGYVKGEGSGALLLKPLSQAQKDGDAIYGIIKSSVVKHAGKTQSLTAPSARAQSQLLVKACTQANIDPETITYIETHGTGTELGDPIEIDALKLAFNELFQQLEKSQPQQHYCGLGSVKTNIGHLEPASGIAGIIKVLLSLRHGLLPKNVHFNSLNPYIELTHSPFYIVDQTCEWKKLQGAQGNPLPRRAGISSFGVGGTNAHIIIEEAAHNTNNNLAEKPYYLLTLSAKTTIGLQQRIKDLSVWLAKQKQPIALASLSYTLNQGRTHFENRCALVVSSLHELPALLQQIMQGQESVNYLIKADNKHAYKEQPMLQALLQLLQREIASNALLSAKDYQQKLLALANLYVEGYELDWEIVYQDQQPQRINLPTYPFVKKRYWYDRSVESDVIKTESTTAVNIQLQVPAEKLPNIPPAATGKLQLRALVAAKNINAATTETNANIIGLANVSMINTSLFTLTIKERTEESITFSLLVNATDTVCMKEHIVYGQPLMSTDGYLEMLSNAAYTIVGNQHFKLTNLQLLAPLIGQENISHQLDLIFKKINNNYQFGILSTLLNATNQQTLHVKGLLEIIPGNIHPIRQIEQLHLPAARKILAADIYNSPNTLHSLGQFFCSINTIHYTDTHAIVELQRPEHHLFHEKTMQTNPAIIDGVLVAAMLITRARKAVAEVFLPLNIKSVTFYQLMNENFYRAYLTQIEDSDNEVVFDIELLNNNHALIMSMQGLRVRKMGQDVITKHIAQKTTTHETEQQNQLKIQTITPYRNDETIKELIKTHLAETLFIEASSLNEQKNFQEMGIDSILGIELIKRLKEAFTINIDTTILYSHPNLAKLAAYLATEIGSAEPVQMVAHEMTQTNHSEMRTAGNDGVNIKEIVKTHLAETLFIEASSLNEQKNFQEMGIDSILGIEFIKRLNTAFNINLDSTTLYSYPDIDKLVECLIKQLKVSTLKIERKEDNLKQTENKSPVVQAEMVINQTITSEPSKQQNQGIAIVGMSGRFACADNVEMFWTNLINGKDCVTAIPTNRWDADFYYDANPKAINKTYSKVGAFINNVDQFDPVFFNISPREAEIMDPQQRLFLEEAWKALEDAGYTHSPLADLKCGVFVGATAGDYAELLSAAQLDNTAYAFTGLSPSILASRIAYYLNLKGAAVAIDTACSSSLVAIHLACESILSGQCKMALAGGVALMLTPQLHIKAAKANMLSPTGACKPFSQQADGISLGEGAGVLVLKPLNQAIQDGDNIYGVIKGSGINQDGATNGITAPNPIAQTELELAVYERAGISAADITLVEAHGTGTKLGDPIEIKALTDAFRQHTDKTNYCAIGSVKSNIGHTLLAAGVASVIKVLLALKYKKIPLQPHFLEKNQHIDFEKSPFYINTSAKDWERINNKPRLAAISSFGFSGTNAHIIIEEGPEQSQLIQTNKPGYILALSAINLESLQQRINDLYTWMKAHPTVALEQVAYTLNAKRRHFSNYRCALVAADTNALFAILVQVQTQIQLQANNYFYQAESDLPVDNTIDKKMLVLMLEELNKADTLNTKKYQENLQTLAKLYVKGYDLDWELLHQGENKRHVNLPTYPFLRERYWVPIAINEIKLSNSNQTVMVEQNAVNANSVLIKETIGNILKVNPLHLKDNQSFEKLGIDSIALMEIVTKLGEAMSMDIKIADLIGVNTIAKLNQFLTNHNTVKKQAILPESTIIVRNVNKYKNESIKDLFGYDELLINSAGSKPFLVKAASGLALEVIIAGQGEPIVFLPPIDSVYTAWQHQFLKFAKNYQVISLHYPGYGRSEFDHKLASFEQISSDIMEILNALHINNPIHLVGWSMGGLIAQVLSVHYADRIKTLTLVNTTSKLDEKGSVEDVHRLVQLLVEDFQLASNSNNGTKSAIKSEHIKGSYSNEVALHYASQLFEFDYREKLNVIKAPTLIISGKKDKLTVPRYAIEMHNTINYSKYYEFKNGGHYIPLFNSQYFNTKLANFLKLYK